MLLDRFFGQAAAQPYPLDRIDGGDRQRDQRTDDAGQLGADEEGGITATLDNFIVLP